MHRIIRRAGLETWPRTFQNPRSTRETEWSEQYPIHVVCKWIGNSPAIAATHELQLTDEHFARATRENDQPKATQNPTQKVNETARNGQNSQHGYVDDRTDSPSLYPSQDCRGLSLGAVLLYGQMFVEACTELNSLEEAFAKAYPGVEPPMPLSRYYLLRWFANNIYPLVPDTRMRSIGLLSDLVGHGVGALAETLALSALDRSCRAATGRRAQHQQRRSLVELIRSIGSPSPAPPPRPPELIRILFNSHASAIWLR